jgi:hypothetical protein
VTKKARKLYVADFETTKDPNDCRVWEWGITQIGNSEHFEWGKDLDEFMDWVYYRKGNPIIYFHNGGRFDFEFVVYWLFENGFRYSRKPEPKTFNTLITRDGQFYSMEITWGIYGKYKKTTTFYDSHKKLPFSVSNVAKAFKLPMEKGDCDHDKIRPFGYDPTKEEIFYVERDCKIVAAALHIQFQQDLTKMTVASDAMNHFQDILGGKEEFERLFPVIPLNMNDQIRYAYRGGFTYCSPRFAGVDLGEGLVFDRNSLYPWVMYEFPLPYGMPVPYEGKYEFDETYPLFIQEITCEFKLKPNHIPTIQVKSGRYQENVYLESHIDESGNDEPQTLYLTNMDLEQFFAHYDVPEKSIRWGGGYKFQQCTGVFKDYIDYWTAIKVANAEEKNALYTLSKLMLNSLYGRFAFNPEVTQKYPVQNKDGSISYKLPRDEEGEEIKEFTNPVYTAMGVFITSWARFTTIESCQQNFDRFAYADTDSQHLLGTEIPTNLDIHPSRLGAWAHEGTFRRARFIRQKTYIEDLREFNKETGEWEWNLHVTCAGMPEAIKENVTWENFQVGFRSGGKLLPRHVKGGIVLSDTEFTLKGTKAIEELTNEQLYAIWEKEADVFDIGSAVKQHGFMKTIQAGEPFYEEYRGLERSIKMRYFRKEGIPFDVFADTLLLTANDLMEKLKR